MHTLYLYHFVELYVVGSTRLALAMEVSLPVSSSTCTSLSSSLPSCSTSGSLRLCIATITGLLLALLVGLFLTPNNYSQVTEDLEVEVEGEDDPLLARGHVSEYPDQREGETVVVDCSTPSCTHSCSSADYFSAAERLATNRSNTAEDQRTGIW